MHEFTYPSHTVNRLWIHPRFHICRSLFKCVGRFHMCRSLFMLLSHPSRFSCQSCSGLMNASSHSSMCWTCYQVIYERRKGEWVHWWVGSLKLQVSFAKEPNKWDDILRKRPKWVHSFVNTVEDDTGFNYMCLITNMVYSLQWGLFRRISSHLLGSFAKETCNFKEPTHRSHTMCVITNMVYSCIHQSDDTLYVF